VIRRPVFVLCTTIVAVFQLHSAAAAAVSEDVPLPGGTAAFAQMLGIDPPPERARFVYEIARLLFNTPEGRKPAADAFLLAMRQRAGREPRVVPADPRTTELVPVPLTTDVWSDAIFHRKVAPRDLVATILADRAAALLCLGLTALDDRTLAYFGDRPALLERIYQRSAPAFGAFAGSIRVVNNRVVPAGAPVTASDHDEVTPLWESLLLEKTTRAERFITQLLELNEGKTAYLYATIGQLDPPRRAFALGLWLTDGVMRADRFKALVTGAEAFRESHLRTLPFGRASYDLSMTLMRLQVEADGTPRPPAARGFWNRVFASTELPPGDEAARQLRSIEEEPIDAAWLVAAVGPADVRSRAERLDQLALGQRAFASAPAEERGDVFVAVRSLARYRMLASTLDRIGIRTPATYATIARQAARIGSLEGRRGFEAQAQFQGGLALLARMVQVHTLDAARAQALVEQLAAVPLTDGVYAGGIARWLTTALVPAIPRGDTIELAVLAAMSGPASGEGPNTRPVMWEGAAYRLDLGAAERRRLQQVRDKQEGAPLDVPIAMAAAARTLAADKAALDDLQRVADRLTASVADIPRRAGRDGDETSPPGVAPPPNAAETLHKTLDELVRHIKSKDIKRAARLAEPLLQQSDTLLALALPSIAYAAVVGDPEGAVMLADDVSRRHDFGFAAKDADIRMRTAWSVPRPEVTPGVPWHVNGSLLGLDIALAQLALRRLNFDRVLEAPKVTSNERDTFALSVSLLNPFDHRDRDRDAIAEALQRGRQRIAAIAVQGAGAATPNADGAFDRLADELSIDGPRRRAIRWLLGHEPMRVASMFSTTEILLLGGGRAADLHAWGMSMLAWQGCVCSGLMPAGIWSSLLGRPPLGLTATAIADLNLTVAVLLKDMGLPAALAKVVLGAATQDFLDEVRPTDDADWLTLARAARSLTRERIEDYIGAATATGPLMPASGRPGSPQP
jgi:hypothetical protein